MTPLLSRFARIVSIVLILIGGAVGGIGGCADIVTYGKDSRAEGQKLLRQQDYANAAGAFRNAVRQNPRDYMSYCYLGQSYEAMGQHQQAIQAFRSSLEVMDATLAGRQDVEFRQHPMNGLAGAIAKSDTRDVETNIAETKARTHGGAQNYFLLAKIHAFRGDADSALEAYNRAALIEPQNFYIHKEYGLYLERLGQTNAAATPLRRAYALNNDDAEVIASLRRMGVVPGPSLKDEGQLARPTIPKGPIPEVPTLQRTPSDREGAGSAQMPRD